MAGVGVWMQIINKIADLIEERLEEFAVAESRDQVRVSLISVAQLRADTSCVCLVYVCG